MSNKNSERLAVFVERLKKIVVREAKETRIATNIFIKLIYYHFKISDKQPSKKEILFLKEHSIDLFKILPMILMFPTPIPYIEIAIALKAFGIGSLLPQERDLEIPEKDSDQ